MRSLTTSGVDVVDVRGVAGGREVGGVRRGVLRARGTLRGAEAGDVLRGEDQDVATDVRGHLVGEVRAGDGRLAALGGEPHAHRVTRGGAGDGAAVLRDVAVEAVAVAFAAGPLRDGGRPRGSPVDGVAQPLVLERSLGQDGDRLGGAVGVGERVRHEVRHRAADHGDRVVGVGGGPCDREGEGHVLGVLGLDEGFVVGEVEDHQAVLGEPLVVGVRVAGGLAGAHLGREAERPVADGRMHVGLTVDRVELGGDVRVVAGHGGFGVVTGHRLVDEVVGRRSADLPADAVEQQLGS